VRPAVKTWEPTDIVIGETYETWTGKTMWVTDFKNGAFYWTAIDGGKHITPTRQFLASVRRQQKH
jgi:hypothetical protein